MQYYCRLIAFNSKSEIAIFRPKRREKTFVNELAQSLKSCYRFIVVCHNEKKADLLLSVLRNSTFPKSCQIVSIV
jgi:hypothetical protein